MSPLPAPSPAPRPAAPPAPTGAPAAAQARGPLAHWAAGLAYGALGLPLAFVALPLYVVLPDHYARAFGVPLAWLGALLLAARALDALADPWLGQWVDQLLQRPRRTQALVGAGAALLLAGCFHGLMFPPPALRSPLESLLGWCALMLAGCYGGYSLLTIGHQAWGARLGGDAAQRTRVAAWREGLALAGVLIASVLAGTAGLAATSAVLALGLALGLLALARAPRPAPASGEATPLRWAQWLVPWRVATLRRLLLVNLLNGVASAVPATLVLFFVRDQLQAPERAPLFLGLYFAAAALSLPLWIRLVARIGLVAGWACGMALAVASFAWAGALGPGDSLAYAGLCLASGAALGADLSIPPALLAGLLRQQPADAAQDGAWFGWWQFINKLALALSAGLALPLLQALGYTPGQPTDGASALSWVYGGLPCLLKLGAAAALWRFHLLHTESPA